MAKALLLPPLAEPQRPIDPTYYPLPQRQATSFGKRWPLSYFSSKGSKDLDQHFKLCAEMYYRPCTRKRSGPTKAAEEILLQGLLRHLGSIRKDPTTLCMVPRGSSRECATHYCRRMLLGLV